MKSPFKRLMAWCLCLVMVAGLLPLSSLAVSVADTVQQNHYGNYETLAMIYNQGDCYSMQGMTLDSSYTYCAKINDSTDASCIIVRTDKATGTKTNMINSETGGYYFTNLGHAHTLDVDRIGDVDQLLVTTGPKLVLLTISGSTLTTAGSFTASYNGSDLTMYAAQIMCAAENEVKVVVRNGRTLYTGSFDPTASGSVIQLTRLCTLNVSSVRIKGVTTDFSTFEPQGMDYHDGKLFLSLVGETEVNTSVVVVYDLEGASGDLKNDPTLSFRVISSAYSALFAIDDLAICPISGQLYFSTNRRKTDADTDYDSCSYFLDYVYDPSMSATGPGNYRWETVDDELISVSTGGCTLNRATRFHGSITDSVITDAQFSLSRSVILKHDSPWVVEWKSVGSFYNGTLLMSTARDLYTPNAPYLYRAQDSKLIGIGYYNGTSFNNYGICLSDHGISSQAEHIYRLTNKLSDGSNMIYLSVDGKELGPMNNHFLGTVSQGTTSDWLSGKDFTFSYFGTRRHPVNACMLDYLQVWAQGEPPTPRHYRWETTGDNLTSTGDSNAPVIYSGSLTSGNYTSAAFRLEAPIILKHDRPWNLEWESQGTGTGGTFLLSAGEGGKNLKAPYLFRSASELIAFGRYDGSNHTNYGVKLSDHGIDVSQRHVYRLTNRIAADGSNMVYLYVDDQPLGAMNKVHTGSTALGYTSDWLNGRDLVFDYLGNVLYPLKGAYYRIEVWEDGRPCNVVFRDHDGTVLGTSSCKYGETPTEPAAPVRPAEGNTSYTFTGWEPAFGEACGDTQYVATYRTDIRAYTVIFKNDDGTVLDEQVVEHGTVPTLPSAPTKAPTVSHSYSFVGWSPDVTAVTQDTVFTARFVAALRKYTVTFRNADGSVLNRQLVPYGYAPTDPSIIPVRKADSLYHYTFIGWSPAPGNITGDTNYTATFSSGTHVYQSTTTAATCVTPGQTVHTCRDCGYSYTEALPVVGHSYANGSCITCGAADPSYVPSIVKPTLTLKVPTLEFKDMICITAFYTAENLQNVAEMGMITYSSKVTTPSVATAEHVIPGATYDENSGRYYSSSQGIHAKYLADTVYLAVYAKLSDGSYVYSKLAPYSAVTYATSQLKNSTDASLKQLVVAMLNYGAEAQLYFGHNTGSLANASLTAEQKALPEAYRADMVKAVAAPSAMKQGSFANNSGFAKRIPAISFEGAFCINYFFTPKYAPDNGITLYYWNAAAYSRAGVLTAANATGSLKLEGSGTGEYRGDIAGIAAKGLSDAIYVAAVYENGGTTWTSGVLGYSIGAYCSSQASKGGDVAALAKATAVYGYHAKQYFG